VLPPPPFPFLLTALTIFLSFWFFFLLFIGVFRPDQQFWHLCYVSVHLHSYCAVHLIHGRCCCLLIVFLLWIWVFFSLDLLSCAIYEMKVSQVWLAISHGLDSSVWGVISHGRLNKFLWYLTTLVLDLVCSEQIYSLTIFVHGLVEDESHR